MHEVSELAATTAAAIRKVVPKFAILANGTWMFLGLFSSGCVCHWTACSTEKEFDLEAPRICLGYIVLTMISTLWISILTNDLIFALRASAFALIVHAAGVLVSAYIYRATGYGKHRLSTFPGPWLAKLSHFYMMFLTIKRWHLYEELQNLHREYGDYVRVGPNSLSIIDPLAVKAINGPQSRCTKGPMYDIAHPRHTLHFTRGKQEHALRRRTWRRAFGSKSIMEYGDRLDECTGLLIDNILRTAGRPINAAELFNLFSFDAMGLVGFGSSFGRLRDGKMNYYMKSLHKNTLMAGIFFHLPWIVQILKQVPLFNVQYTSFIAHSKRIAEERLSQMSEGATIFGPVVTAYHEKGEKTLKERHNLYGDADLIVVAGSDTIAAALTAAAFCLARNPKVIKEARKLVKEASDTASAYIDAIILETLRLHPVISSGLQRITPPEGIHIGTMFVPGNVRVQIPSYVMFRDDRSFVYPNSFLPERFLPEGAHLMKDPSIYVPFNTGIYSCIGRQLAMLELNIVLTQLIVRFNFELAPGQTEEAFLQAKRDTFTLFIRDLQLIFRSQEN